MTDKSDAALVYAFCLVGILIAILLASSRQPEEPRFTPATSAPAVTTVVREKP